MNDKVLKKIFSILCLVFCSIPLLFPCLTLLIMSTKSYKLVSGLAGSPSVGLANIQAFWNDTVLVQIMKNTLNINIFSMVIGAFYLFVAILAINVFRSRFMRAITALLFVLPAIIPSNAYVLMLQKVLPTEYLVQGSTLLQLIAGTQSALHFSSILVIASLFTKGESVPNAQKYTLLYVALKLIHLFVTDIGFLNSFYNPLTYETLDTYSTYQYRNGLMQSNFSKYAAGYVVQLLLQLLPALFGIFIIASPYRRKWIAKKALNTPDAANNQEFSYEAYDTGNRIYLPSMLLAAIPVALFALVWKTGCNGTSMWSHPRMQQAYTYSFLIAGISAIVMVLFGLLLGVACTHLNSIGIGFLAFLYFLADSLLGPYIFGRSLGFMDTLMGPLVQNMYLVLPIAIITFRILKEHRRKNLLPALTISSLGLAFSWFWGDHMAPVLALDSAEKYPMSVVIYQTLHMKDIDASALLGYGQNEGPLSAALYLLIPVVVTGCSFIVASMFLKKYE